MTTQTADEQVIKMTLPAVQKASLAFSKPRVTAIVKPTYTCNLHCLYCYEGDRSENPDRMTIDTAHQVIDRLVEYNGPGREIQIIWHGGEPLLMGLDFYRDIVQYQQQFAPDYQFDNCFQTNGTLLNEEAADFLTKNQFRVGLSLDGPAWLHNQTRIYPNGNGSFHDVIQGIEMLRKKIKEHGMENKGVFGGVITVLSKALLPHLNEIYQFCIEKKINLKILPLVYTGRGRAIKDEAGIKPAEYARVMRSLFDRWFSSPEDYINLDPFERLISNLLTGKPAGCEFNEACYETFMAISPSGKTYPCGRWGAGDGFSTGDIHTSSIAEILTSSTIQLFRQNRMLALEQCRDCRYKQICNSGCINNSYMIRESLADKDYYCYGYRQLYAHIEKAILPYLPTIGSSEMPASVADYVYSFNIGGSIAGLNLASIDHPILKHVIRDYIPHSRLSSNDHDKYADHTDHTEWRKWTEYSNAYHTDHSEWSRYSRYDNYLD